MWFNRIQLFGKINIQEVFTLLKCRSSDDNHALGKRNTDEIFPFSKRIFFDFGNIIRDRNVQSIWEVSEKIYESVRRLNDCKGWAICKGAVSDGGYAIWNGNLFQVLAV